MACFCSLVGEHERAIDLLHVSETVAAETARENERIIRHSQEAPTGLSQAVQALRSWRGSVGAAR